MVAGQGSGSRREGCRVCCGRGNRGRVAAAVRGAADPAAGLAAVARRERAARAPSRPRWSACWPGGWTGTGSGRRWRTWLPGGWFRLSGTPGPAQPGHVRGTRRDARRAARAVRAAGDGARGGAGGRPGRGAGPALSDGFEGGEPAFMKAFREEVTADAVQRGLTRPRLSGRRIGLLWLVLLVPAGALALALAGAHQRYPLAFGGGSWFGLGLITTGVGVTRRPSAAGRAVLDRWHAARRRGVARRGAAQGAARRARRRRRPRRRAGGWRSAAPGLRGGPGPGARRDGGLRRGGKERGVVQLPGQLAAAPDRVERLDLAAGHRVPAGHHLRPDRCSSAG